MDVTSVEVLATVVSILGITIGGFFFGNRRLDDLRADLNARFVTVDARFAEFLQELRDLRHEFGDLRREFGNLQQEFRDLRAFVQDAIRSRAI